MDPVPQVIVEDRASVSVARERVRAVAAGAGFVPADVERLAIVVSELAQNQLDHARDGRIEVRAIARDGVGGVEIEAVDLGPGIRAVEQVLAGRPPEPGGLGIGLGAVRRLVEELDVDVRLGEGTAVVARRFTRPVARLPEIVVLGRGVETPSGDQARVVRDAAGLLAAVVDGVGHGPEAREVALRAIDEVRPGRGPLEVLAAMHEVLHRTRGAAATVVRWEPGAVQVAGVGNVACRVIPPAGASHHASPTAGLLGAHRRTTPRLHRLPMALLDVLVLFTDGISHRVEPVVAGRSTVSVAAELLGGAKPHDDALVLVAR
ncbi:MAG: ATP-binding protein [Myxococcota bacterium]